MSKTTKTSRIVENLGERLRGGEWVAQTALPSVAALSEEYAVSPGTVALALKSLERDGLVRVLPRQGVLATERAGAGAAANGSKCPTIGLYGGYAQVNQGYMGILTQNILTAAHAAGGALMMLPRLPGGELLTPEHCRAHGVQGVIFLGGQFYESIEALTNAGFPAITANMPTGCTGINFYSYDNCAPVVESFSRFTALGHRRIGVISYESSTPGLVEAAKPFVLQRLSDEGLVYNLNPYWRNVGDLLQTEMDVPVVEALEHLFALPEPPTALLCRSSAAQHILAWAAKRGLRVPEDFSLVALGYPEGEALSSGYQLQHSFLGRKLVESLHELIRNPFLSIQKTVLLPFVDKGTVAPAPQTAAIP